MREQLVCPGRLSTRDSSVQLALCTPPKGSTPVFLTCTLVPMAADMRGMASEIESLIRQTQQNGSIVTVIKQGYIMKRSTNMRREWKRRFFVLDSAGMLYYYSNKVGAKLLLKRSQSDDWFNLESW